MLSISSASSNTTVFTELKSTALRCTKSINRPGVATIICVGRLNDAICLSICSPPYTASVKILSVYFVNLNNCFATCFASSRVGHKTKPCTVFLLGSIFSNNGIPYAAVFPVPVCACATISVAPAKSTGITFF